MSSLCCMRFSGLTMPLDGVHAFDAVDAALTHSFRRSYVSHRTAGISLQEQFSCQAENRHGNKSEG